MHRVVLIEGDGIGQEVVTAAVLAIAATGVQIDYEKRLLGLSALNELNDATPKETFDAIRKAGVALKGPTTTPVGGGHRSANVALRQELDLYACIRPIRSIPGVSTRYDRVDMVIFRENTEGLYCGKELLLQKGMAVSLRIMTEEKCLRIAKKAFQYAEAQGRKKVCAVHKANILKVGDGLYLDAVRHVQKDYPNLEYSEVIVDALCMKLVEKPEQFDVLITENMFGDIISDLGAGLIGGLGVAPGANIGDHWAVFEATHGSAPDIAGKDLANPTAMMKSAIMMLEYLKEPKAAGWLRAGLYAILQEKSLQTKDLGGRASTAQFTERVVTAIKKIRAAG